jgi:hypothetical protein
MKRQKFQISRFFSRTTRWAFLAVAGLGLVESSSMAAPPYLDEDGYYWSETKKEGENPIIWDRADLVLYTDGVWRWTLTDGGQTLMKQVGGDFYNPAVNKRLNELAAAIAQARAKVQEVENELSAKVMAKYQPADEAAAAKFNEVLAKFRRGERGEGMARELSGFIKPDEAKAWVAERDKRRAAIFDALEGTNQAMRMDFGLRTSRRVASVIVSERAMFVPATTASKPLETDDSREAFSESLGMAYRLIPDGKGTFLAVLSTKPQPGSAAESLELLTGDAVSAINDQPIRSEGDLNRLTFPQTIITIMKTFGGEPKRVVISTSRR